MYPEKGASNVKNFSLLARDRQIGKSLLPPGLRFNGLAIQCQSSFNTSLDCLSF